MDVNLGGKYIETEWRKTPQYQGGLLLDGGVHMMAGLRKILPSKPARITAFTRLNREFLLPHDTIHSSWLLEDGSTGAISISFASSGYRHEIELMGQEGSIVVKIGYPESSVTLHKRKQDPEVKGFNNDNKIAIAGEFEEFAKAIKEGKKDPRGDPMEALADLTAIESILQSGANGGQPIAAKF